MMDPLTPAIIQKAIKDMARERRRKARTLASSLLRAARASTGKGSGCKMEPNTTRGLQKIERVLLEEFWV